MIGLLVVQLGMMTHGDSSNSARIGGRLFSLLATHMGNGQKLRCPVSGGHECITLTTTYVFPLTNDVKWVTSRRTPREQFLSIQQTLPKSLVTQSYLYFMIASTVQLRLTEHINVIV